MPRFAAARGTLAGMPDETRHAPKVALRLIATSEASLVFALANCRRNVSFKEDCASSEFQHTPTLTPRSTWNALSGEQILQSNCSDTQANSAWCSAEISRSSTRLSKTNCPVHYCETWLLKKRRFMWQLHFFPALDVHMHANYTSKFPKAKRFNLPVSHPQTRTHTGTRTVTLRCHFGSSSGSGSLGRTQLLSRAVLFRCCAGEYLKGRLVSPGLA